MNTEIEAVVFDIDGTLYPDRKLFIRIIPFLIKNLRFMKAFGAVRKEIRAQSIAMQPEVFSDLFDAQAALLAQKLHTDKDAMRDFVETEIYSGWQKHFRLIEPFAGVKECFSRLKEHGYKLGVLSDFVPRQKGDLWGLEPLCDVFLGSEDVGALKPSVVPFLAVAQALELPPEKILYVGNSAAIDVQGARKAGMKTAAIQGRLATFFNKNKKDADIFFSTYRKFLKNVIQ